MFVPAIGQSMRAVFVDIVISWRFLWSYNIWFGCIFDPSAIIAISLLSDLSLYIFISKVLAISAKLCEFFLYPTFCSYKMPNNCKDIFLFGLEVGYLEVSAGVCNKPAESIVPCQLKHCLRRVGFWLTMAQFRMVLQGLYKS